MNTADAAGRKDFDSGAMSDPRRGSDCRRAVQASRDGNRNVSRADFLDVAAVCERVDLIIVEPNRWFAVDDRDRGWYRSCVTNDLFKAMRGLQVLRTRQAMRDHGRFKR